jgi:hypothetical protein
MDRSTFDRFAQAFVAAASRRRLLGLSGSLPLAGLLGLVSAEADAKKKRKHKKKLVTCIPNCIDRTCGSDGCGGSCGSCRGNQVCQGGMCCTPEPLTTTCSGLCGTRTNNCNQSVTCPSCTANRTCLSNGSCADPCGGADCPGGCVCGLPNAAGTSYCVASSACPTGPSCATTADCPPGSHCQGCPDLASLVCIPLCVATFV